MEIKKFIYSDITVATYSYSKKPLMPIGGAITALVFLGFFSLPILLIKQKQHWISIGNKDDFVVMRLNKKNLRQITDDFENHNIRVTTADENNYPK